MRGEPARFDALVARFMSLGGADRRAVLASLSPDERDLFEREFATARNERRRERDRAQLAHRQFVGYSPWLATIIGNAAKAGDEGARTRTATCDKAILLAHRTSGEQTGDEKPLGRFLRQLGLPGFAAGADEPG